MRFRIIICWLLFNSGVFLWAQTTAGEQDTPLRSFLENRSFTELLNQYRQESITLNVKGRQARRIANRPYHMDNGFRCQIFAGASLANAEDIAYQLKALNLDTVYVFEEDRLYKVQMGDFQSRTDTEMLLNRLKDAGFRGAWIVDSVVRVAKSSEEQQASARQAMAQEQQFYDEQNFIYTIQVFATGDPAKANEISRALQNEIQQPARVQQQGSVWKVLIGHFTSRRDAEQLLNSLKRRRYADAWITQVTAN